MTRTAETPNTTATLAAWREQGACRIDPLRFLHLEALARRVAAQTGETRRLLDARLAVLMDGYQDAMALARSCVKVAGTHAPDPVSPGAQRSILGRLVDELTREALPAKGEPALPAARTHPGSPMELKALRRFQGTWSRLSAEQRLRQVLAHVPPQAGPLNSHHLMHRALVLMRETSPAYLQRFVTHVDTLLWLDQLQASLVAVPARAQKRRKAGR